MHNPTLFFPFFLPKLFSKTSSPAVGSMHAVPEFSDRGPILAIEPRAERDEIPPRGDMGEGKSRKQTAGPSTGVLPDRAKWSRGRPEGANRGRSWNVVEGPALTLGLKRGEGGEMEAFWPGALFHPCEGLGGVPQTCDVPCVRVGRSGTGPCQARAGPLFGRSRVEGTWRCPRVRGRGSIPPACGRKSTATVIWVLLPVTGRECYYPEARRY